MAKKTYDVKDMPGHLVRRFQQIAVAVFHTQVSAAGSDLTPVQYAALSQVRATPGLDQATLAGLIAYDRATIGGVVDRLIDKGFVAREVSAKDRRARVLQVTPKGHELLEHIEPAVLAAQEQMLGALDSGEAREFMRLLRKATDGANDLSRAPMRAPTEQG